MKLSKSMTLIGITVSSLISGCKPIQSIYDKLSSSNANSNAHLNVLVGNFNGDSRNPDILCSTLDGLVLMYPKRKDRMNSKLVYPENFTKKDKGKYGGHISKEFINDDNYLDIVYSSPSEISVLINNGKGKFTKKQSINLPSNMKTNDDISENKSYDMPSTLIQDDNGLYLLISTNDKIIRLKANYDGVFSNSYEILHSFDEGKGKNVSSLTTGYLNNDEFKDILITSLDGVFILETRVDSTANRNPIIKFEKSGNLYSPRKNGMNNKNSLAAVCIDNYSGSKDNNFDDVLIVNNDNMIYYENTFNGRLKRGEELSHGLKLSSRDVSLGADVWKRVNHTVIYVGTSKKIEQITLEK